MLFSTIASSIAGKLASIPVKPAVSFLESLLADRQAFAFAKEAVRAKYSALVSPADYDFVAENFVLTKQDFIDYFRSAQRSDAHTLDAFLKARLLSRAALWQHNRPSESVYAEMIDQFYEAYVRYFVTSDLLLGTLQVQMHGNETLDALREIQDVLSRLARELKPADIGVPSVLGNLQVALKLAAVPFDVIESTPTHLDLILADPMSLLPVRCFAGAFAGALDQRALDELRQRADASGTFSHVVALAEQPADVERLSEYARKRRIVVYSVDAFLALLGGKARAPVFVIGELGANALRRALRIHDVYIPPDAVVTKPSDETEVKLLGTRVPSDDVVDTFLQSPGLQVLIVLGDYGSGKSAFAAHTLHRLSTSASAHAAAYVPLRDLRSSEELVDTTLRCMSAMRAMYPGRKGAVAILDGVDELPNAMDLVERKRNLLSILRAGSLGGKLIVTIRLSYFRGITDFWSFFADESEAPLWGKLARHLPGGENRPGVHAMVLREFDTEQVEKYIRAVGRQRGREAAFLSAYQQGLADNDLDGTYAQLQRSPLSLYLLVHTEPWHDGSVACFADVIAQFINFWLERDIEKGPARWLLSTADRKEFVDAVAWHLFREDKTSFTAAEFMGFVRDYFGPTQLEGDLDALALDLQTVGMFTPVGNTLSLALRAYGDYFVAQRFAFSNEPMPRRLPDAYQVRMWLGLVETRERTRRFAEPADAAWLNEMLTRRNVAPLELGANGILCGRHRSTVGWPRANSDDYAVVRAIMHAALEVADPEPLTTLRRESVRRTGDPAAAATVIRQQIKVALRIGNRLGLHARATADFIRALRASERSDLQRPGNTSVIVRRDGKSVNGHSFMDILCLSAAMGACCEMLFINWCDAEVLDFLRRIGATPGKGGINDVWTASFGEEIDGGRHIYHVDLAPAAASSGP